MIPTAAATVAVLGAATLLTGVATEEHANITMCESESTFEPIRRFVTRKGGIRDPMTSYARYALQREQLYSTEVHNEEGNVQKTQRSSNEKEQVVVNVAAVENKELLVASTTPSPLSVSTRATVQATSAATDTAPPSTTGPPLPSGTPPFLAEMTASEVRLEEATRKAKQHAGGLKIFSGNGNMSLALEITRHLGISLGKATVGRFADGEVNVVIHDNVRGKDVYIVQPTGPPVNDNIMELLLMVSTLRRASARRITVVIPYYGYARQDRKMQVRFSTMSFFPKVFCVRSLSIVQLLLVILYV
jgi:hypothetical protein